MFFNIILEKVSLLFYLKLILIFG